MSIITSIYIMQFLLVLSLDTSPDELPLHWPFFGSDLPSESCEMMVGYGDWCFPLEGPHPGADFYAEEGDDVVNSFNDTMYSLGADYGVLKYGGVLGIGFEGSVDGWAYQHITTPGGDQELWAEMNERGTEYPPNASLGTCTQYDEVPRHLHLSWSHWEIDDDHPGGAILPDDWHDWVNPLNWFGEFQLDDYDGIAFQSPRYCFNGIWFMPDAHESTAQIIEAPGHPDPFKFQSTVSGAVDIAASPYSSLVDWPDITSAGVYSSGYSILWQNPYLLTYNSTSASLGSWGFRRLANMNDELPWSEDEPTDTDEYRSVYLDGNLPGGQGEQDWIYFAAPISLRIAVQSTRLNGAGAGTMSGLKQVRNPASATGAMEFVRGPGIPIWPPTMNSIPSLSTRQSILMHSSQTADMR